MLCDFEHNKMTNAQTGHKRQKKTNLAKNTQKPHHKLHTAIDQPVRLSARKTAKCDKKLHK